MAIEERPAESKGVPIDFEQDVIQRRPVSSQAGLAGEDIPLEARILKVALDLDSLTLCGSNLKDAITEMKARAGTYDKGVLEIAERWVKEPEAALAPV